jgi:hypothetical protein
MNLNLHSYDNQDAIQTIQSAAVQAQHSFFQDHV